ncbi:hypothetical protein [Primorskyibacter sp. S87]|uniref:hypothetical protein n=1 Tax=Primorskyibacter sp. S87 TaxID=3415126 RepID=UPI003C7BF5A6
MGTIGCSRFVAARLGAQAVLVPAALMSLDPWVDEFTVPSRDLENNMTVAYTNRIDAQGNLPFIGKSQLCPGDTARRVIASHSYHGLIAIEHQANAGMTYFLASLAQRKPIKGLVKVILIFALPWQRKSNE